MTVISTTESEPGTAPRDFAALRALIVGRAPDLPRRLTQVATSALDNPDEIAFGTAAGVAQRAGVQPSTLVRFSQALGYQGFSDLQEVFRARLRERVPSYDERLAQLREHGLDASKTGLLLAGFSMVLDVFSAWAPQAVVDAIASLSFLTHFESISKGVIDVRDLVYFALLIGFALYANTLILELKKAD